MTRPVCTKRHSRESLWWDCCGDKADGCAAYAKGREELLGILEALTAKDADAL